MSCLFISLERSLAFLKTLLFADVLGDLGKLETYGRNSIASRPEVLTREIAILAFHPSNGNRALALQEADDAGHGMLGWDGYADVDVVGHDMAFHDGTLLLFCQGVKYLSEMFSDLPPQYFSAILGYEDDMILAVPTRMTETGIQV